jgi:CHRD domain
MGEAMKRSTVLTGVLAVMFLAMAVAPAAAQNIIIDNISAHEVGYRETPLTINSNGTADFKGTISQDGTSITYTESYQNLSSTVTQSHIHFGRPAITGGIVLFLCTNLTPPAGVPTPQACPPAPATITGTLTAADVIALPDQGVDSGAAGFAEMIRAIRAHAAYANVHTVNHPGGEVRGVLDEPND